MSKRPLFLILCLVSFLPVFSQKNDNRIHNEWNDKSVYEIDKEAPRTNVTPYSDEDGIEKCKYQESKYYVSLNGTWQFCLKSDFHDFSSDLTQRDFSTDGWSSTTVPDHAWRLNGKTVLSPLLNNVLVIPSSGNSCAAYAREFYVPKEWKSSEVFLQLQAKSACYVWVNRQLAGYSEDSRDRCEFNISKHLKYGKDNDIIIEVISASDGSLLEMGYDRSVNGITGDVALILKPEVNIHDFAIHAGYSPSSPNGNLSIDIDIANRLRKGRYYVEVELWNPQGREVEKWGKWVFFDKRNKVSATIEGTILNAEPWSAESPSLYTAVIRLLDEDMKLMETVGSRFGFRSISLEEGRLSVNGKYITLRGVNYIDHNSGKENTREALLSMKRNNINAIRTAILSPAPSYLYELCDELGLFVVCDANIQPYSAHNKVIATDADYTDLFISRAVCMYERLKNHPSIIAWSLGENRDNGVCMSNTYKRLKQTDPSRPIIYGGAGFGENSDIISILHTTPNDIHQYLSKQQSRPLLFLSFGSAKGNSFGNIEPLWQRVRENECLLGGFASSWDSFSYSLQGQPSQENGISDKPYLDELREIYRPFDIHLTSLSQDAGEFSISNLCDFFSSSDFRISYVIYTNMKPRIIEGDVTQKILPGETKSFKLKLPKLTLYAGEELFIKFVTKPRTQASAIGSSTILSTTTIPLPHQRMEKQPMPEYERTALSVFENHADTLNPSRITDLQIQSASDVNGNHLFDLQFDMMKGAITSFKFHGDELFSNAPHLNFWRHPTDNDLLDKNGAQLWQSLKPTAMAREVLATNYRKTDEGTVVIDVMVRYSNSQNAPLFDVRQKYTILYSGDVIISNDVITTNAIKSIPRMGMQFSFCQPFDTLEWYGSDRESYSDRQTGVAIGCFKDGIQSLAKGYTLPQESGNHTHTRWNAIYGSSYGLYFDMLDTIYNFSVASASAEQYVSTSDPRPNNAWLLNIDYRMAGIGCADAGINIDSKHLLSDQRYNFPVHLRPFDRAENDPRDFSLIAYPTQSSSSVAMPEIACSRERFDAPMEISISIPQQEQDTKPKASKTAPNGKGAKLNKTQIHYTLDGSTPTEKSPLYTGPFTIENSTIVNARAFADGETPSFVSSRRFNYDYISAASFKNKPNTPYNYKYEVALFDGELGDIEDLSRNWIGFSSSALDATFSLSKSITMENVKLRFAHHPESWVFAPLSVYVYVSSDGQNFSDPIPASIDYDPTAEALNSPQVIDIEIPVNLPNVRYVRIEARSIGRLPSWHKAKGLKAWMMTDEIIITEKID